MPDSKHENPNRANRGQTDLWRLNSPQDEKWADSNADRLRMALSEVVGLLRGIEHLDYGKVVAVMTPEERKQWKTEANRIVRSIRQMKASLDEASTIRDEALTPATPTLEEVSRNGFHPQ